MDDKMFDLMTQMYSELQNLSGQVGQINEKIDKLDVRLGKVEDKVDKLEKDILRIDHKMDNNSKSLFDGYNQTYEKLEVVEEKLDELSIQVEKQDVEIKVIRNVGAN